MDMVGNGELDCALLSAPHTSALAALPLISDPVVLACTEDHPLAGNSRVRLAELDGERFVETPADWAVRVLVDETFQAANLVRRIVCEVNEWTSVLDLVDAGVGVSLVPAGLDFARYRRHLNVRLIDLADVRLERRLDFVFPTGEAVSPATRRFVELLERQRSLDPSWAAARRRTD
ncbi:LysR family transcriptional regulator substrate-binding protein [Micromonospora sp. WMMD812]|uniref:LysR family transcriptional regulator substrate-binding protein n=1 Tax=Micromonospora sp. WMMD812 TaxID=3015152 RepID=UPI00248C4B05|nr:LysR family transcriptional regulator substrate-binding protein [Micromonospora sp. WMMD812]WBB70839.1 LysR family transcriptional regulator substrate-binding protein [Micromonospora sp. WMMD812]